MDNFRYENGQLCAGRVALVEIADRFDTPCYVYSRAAIEQQWQAYHSAFGGRDHLICYAVKANSNLAVLNILARLGSGFDIVSVGELERVLKAGGEAGKIVFSGVGKKRHEIARALKAGIKCFNVESLSELIRVNEVAAEAGLPAPVSLRVNPDVDAETHPYTATGLYENKFGIPYEDARAVYEKAQSLEHVEVVGIDCHIGSQITTLAPYTNAIERLLILIDDIHSSGITLQHIDVGGGLGISYQEETPPSPAEFVREITRSITDESLEILLEPGRSIVGNAGVLLTRVEYIKQNGNKYFAVIDAAMNDLLRPALYQSWLNILPLNEEAAVEPGRYDVVGPVCESGDFMALDRELSLQEDDLLAICSAGAYGFCMSSNYNSRPRVVEVMVDNDQVYEIRRRETLEELMAGETLLPDGS